MGDKDSPQRVVQSPLPRDHAKDSIYQGGVNVPFVVAGAGVTRKNERKASLINSTDLFAAFAALANTRQKSSADSTSFLPLLTSGTLEGRRELYDLANDPFEKHNLLASDNATDYASIVATLAAQLLVYQH